MKLTFCSITGSRHAINVDSDISVYDARAALSELINKPHSTIRLTYKSRYLDSDTKLSSLNLAQSEFIIYTLVYNEEIPTNHNVPDNHQKCYIVAQKAMKNPGPRAKGKYRKYAQARNATKQVAQLPRNFEENVTNLTSLGFPRDKCIEALHNARFNVEIAADMLLNPNQRHRPLGTRVRIVDSGDLELLFRGLAGRHRVTFTTNMSHRSRSFQNAEEISTPPGTSDEQFEMFDDTMLEDSLAFLLEARGNRISMDDHSNDYSDD